MYSIHHLHMDRVERVWPVIVGLCSAVPVHLARVLLLWSFKAKREYSGVQRQHNTTSTQGQTPVFTFRVAFIVILPRFSDGLDRVHLDSGPQGREVSGEILLRKPGSSKMPPFFLSKHLRHFRTFSHVKMIFFCFELRFVSVLCVLWVLNLLEKQHRTGKALPGCLYGRQKSSQKINKYRRLNPIIMLKMSETKSYWIKRDMSLSW